VLFFWTCWRDGLLEVLLAAQDSSPDGLGGSPTSSSRRLASQTLTSSGVWLSQTFGSPSRACCLWHLSTFGGCPGALPSWAFGGPRRVSFLRLLRYDCAGILW
jgi:hypothetical protein